MNPITVIFAAYIAVTAGTTALCKIFSSNKLATLAPEDAYTGLKQYLDKLADAIDFVSVKNGVFCF